MPSIKSVLAMLLISFAFAFGSFIIASNFFKRVWLWLVSGIVVFVAFFLTLFFSIDVLFIIGIVLFVIMLIITLAKKYLK